MAIRSVYFPLFFMSQAQWLRRAGLAVLAVLLLWLLGWLLVPSLLKAQFQDQLSEQLGRRVTVGHINFKPWSLELEVRDLAIAQVHVADTLVAAPAQLYVQQVYINMAIWRFSRCYAGLQWWTR